MTGIGRDKAAKIWYRTLSTYLTSSSNYAAARNGAIKSAKDLYGASSAECTGRGRRVHARSPSRPARRPAVAPTPPPTGGNLLANPGFESGAASWTGTSGPITNNTGRPAHTGSWKAWLGGNGTTATENDHPVGDRPVHRGGAEPVVLAAHRHRRERVARPTTR